jgi:hypothetical protein
LLLAGLLAAGCTEPVAAVTCPGSPVSTLEFAGSRTLVECAGGGPAAGVNALYPDTVKFTGTLSYATGTTAALCGVHPGAEPLVGTQVADQIDVSLETRGALLSACSARCGVTVLQQVTGTLARGPADAPAGFSGTLTDQATLDATIPGADCTPCVTPCRATYLLTGTPPATR